MVNKTTLLGNLGQDVIIHQFEGGGKVAKATLATSEKWKDKTSGERKEKTTWHNLVFHGPLADLAEKFLKKGSKIYVEGKISNRSWEKDGQKHYATDIVVRDLTFLDSKPQQSPDEGYAKQADGSHMSNAVSNDSEPDDLPF